jgi:hypothetical protein
MSDRQFREADAAIERAVATFISTIERIEGRSESVAPTAILLGPAELKLSNALADYRDSRFIDRGGPLRQ